MQNLSRNGEVLHFVPPVNLFYFGGQQHPLVSPKKGSTFTKDPRVLSLQ